LSVVNLIYKQKQKHTKRKTKTNKMLVFI